MLMPVKRFNAPRPRVALWILGGFLLVLVGCGSGSADDLAAVTSESPDATDGDEPEAAGSKTLDEYLGSVGALVRGGGGPGGPGGAGAAIDTEAVLEEQRQIQITIQSCMQEQGFSYVPEEVDGGLRVFLAERTQGLSEQDYAEQQGFGISTRFDALLDGDVDLTEDTNPNDDHVSTLSEGEADAWDLALSGQPPERNSQGQPIDPETGEVLAGGRGRGGGRATGGCQLAAQQQVRGDITALGELREEFTALDERIEADPRIVEINTEWVECMRDSGFTYDSEDDARSEIEASFRPLVASFFGRGAGAGGGGDAGAALANLELSPEQEAELAQLQDNERAVAVASLECEGDSASEIATIIAGYEADFIDANRETLESIGG